MKRIVFNVENHVKNELDELIERGSLSAFYREVTKEYIRLLKLTRNTTIARLYFTENGRSYLKRSAESGDITNHEPHNESAR